MSLTASGLRWDNLRYSIPLPKKAAAEARAKAAVDPTDAALEKAENGDVQTSESGVDAGMRHILRGISGEVRRGEMVAILGASGAGKTTALNALSARIGKEGELGGSITFDGKPRDPASWKRTVGYVEQDDALFGLLTPKETIGYAASLRLPAKHFSAADKEARVDKIIQSLRLEKAQHTRIGTDSTRGVSGGERKRTSIGVELVANTSLLFLDEPTSGLDAFSAANVIELLRNISRERQLAVLMTIHQPSFKVFSLYDRVSLLARGAVYYSGPPHIAEAWFESLGYATPKGVSPPDHYITLAEAYEKTPEAEARVLGLLSSWAERGEAFVAGFEKDHPARSSLDGNTATNTIEDSKQLAEHNAAALRDETSWPTPWPKELAILTHRVWLQLIRDKTVLFAAMGQTIALLILIGAAFIRLGRSQGDVLARIGVLFIVPVNASFAVSFATYAPFPLERSIIIRERSGGQYRTTSAYIAKMLVVIPSQIAQTLIYYVVLYWMIGLRPGAGPFFIWLGITQLQVIASIGLGFAIGAAVPSVTLAGVLSPLASIVWLLFGSSLLPVSQIPPWFIWLHWISPLSYTFAALAINEFGGDQTFECGSSSAQCYRTGTDVLQAYDLLRFNIGECAGFLVLLASVMFILGYIGLRFGGHPRFRYA